MKKEAITTSMTLAILATDLCAAEAPEPISIAPRGSRNISVHQPLADSLTLELVAQLHQLEEDEEFLGERRRRELRIARHHLARDSDVAFNLRDDDPLAFEETADILWSCLVKITHERLERRFHLDTLDERLGNRWARRHDRDAEGEADKERAWRISPRIDLGSEPYVGANFRLRRGEGDIWSRFTLGLRQRLESDSESVFLEYKDEDRFVRLEQVFGDELAGDQVLLSLRMNL